MAGDDKLVYIPRENLQDMHGGGPPMHKAPPDYGAGAVEEPTHLMDYWQVIVSRRWTVIAVLFTVFLIVLIATLKQTPIYSATASIQIERENQNVLTFKDVYESEMSTDDTLQTQYKILESRSLARRVIEDLKLDQVPEFRASDEGILDPYIDAVRALFATADKGGEKAEPDQLRPFIDRYVRRITVAPVRLARLVRVSFEAEDPALAARVINAHAKHFIDQNFEFKWDATQQASDFLSQQLVQLKANLEKAEDRLQEYSRKSQILFTEEGRNTATEKLKQLEEEFTKAQADRFQKESFDRIVRTGNIEALPQLMTNQLISNLATRLSELRREESEISTTFGPEYPRRKRLRSQIEELDSAVVKERNRIAQTVHAEYMASLEREKLMTSALELQRTEVNRINQEIIQYNILKREVDSNKQLYDGLLTRLKEAGVSAGLRASNIRVVDRAEVPRYAVRPRKSLNLALGLLAGLVLGIGMAFFQEYVDNTIKGPDEVERLLHVPLLGAIPKLGSVSSGYGYYGYNKSEAKSQDRKTLVELVAHEAPSSAMGEAYRSMRTSLLLSAPHHPPKSVVVTSAVPSEGKTVTAINTAISLTQTGTKVVLIDADMRKPRVHTVFPGSNGVGLSNFLTGSSSIKDIVSPTQIPNLYLVPCGVIPPNPAELILTDRFTRLMESLTEYFDYVVLDSPPLAHVSDARIIATHTDAAILVVKANSTSRHFAKRAVDYLREARTRIAGVVLNDVDVSKSPKYYYYKGSYGYGYGGYYGHAGQLPQNSKAPAERA